jgi:periplasmic nitrate reductase NapD
MRIGLPRLGARGGCRAMSELHIASCVGYARPEALESIVRAIHATGLAEVPRQDEKGRMVILIERPTSGEVMDAIDAIRALDGVLAVHLAYQHAEPESTLQEPQP